MSSINNISLLNNPETGKRGDTARFGSGMLLGPSEVASDESIPVVKPATVLMMILFFLSFLERLGLFHVHIPPLLLDERGTQGFSSSS